MQKRKIAIVFNRFGIGGAENALYNFLNEIDKKRYEIFLLTADVKKTCLSHIPDDVHIMSTAYDDARETFLSDMKAFHWLRAFKGIVFRLLIRLSRDDYYEYMWTQLSYPKIQNSFDCVIAYKMNFEDPATALFRVRARKKCAIVHSNIKAENKKINRFVLLLLSLLLDKIFCVSEDNQKEWNIAYPFCAHKTETMLNVIYPDEIIHKALEPVEAYHTPCAICTVGRLAPVKGQTMVPKTAHLLLEAGYDFKWYLIGDGNTRPEIENLIQQYDVADRVILLGTKMNPYPYMKNCTIYVQPSFSEGYCTTTMEAKILRKPIVTTDVPGMREQFVSGENGLIVDDMTPESLFSGIQYLLDHPEMQQKFMENLSHETCDNSGELQKLYDFIES